MPYANQPSVAITGQYSVIIEIMDSLLNFIQIEERRILI